MKKIFRTDGIGIEIELDEEKKTLKQIIIKEIDIEVFPELDIFDKMKMSWFVNDLAGKVMTALADQGVWANGPPNKGR